MEKTHLAEAIGHAACRKVFSVLFVKAQCMLANLTGGRADGTRERRLRTYLAAARAPAQSSWAHQGRTNVREKSYVIVIFRQACAAAG